VKTVPGATAVPIVGASWRVAGQQNTSGQRTMTPGWRVAGAPMTFPVPAESLRTAARRSGGLAKGTGEGKEHTWQAV
jgi:hypothetical protein